MTQEKIAVAIPRGRNMKPTIELLRRVGVDFTAASTYLAPPLNNLTPH